MSLSDNIVNIHRRLFSVKEVFSLYKGNTYMKLIASNLDFSNVLKLEGIVNSLAPEVRLENLNSYLYYNYKQNCLSILVKGTYAYARIDISASIETEGESNILLMVSMNNITNLISNYSNEQKNTLKMIIEVTENKSIFKFESLTDNVNFAHLLLKSEDIVDIEKIIDSLDSSQVNIILSLKSYENQQAHIMNGINNCLDFIDDVQRNNAIAIYNDRFVVADRRHIYIYYYNTPIEITDQPISLHKKIAKNIIDLYAKEANPYFEMYSDSKVLITSEKYKFSAILNNKMANIAPPDNKDITSIKPVEHLTSIKRTDFWDLVNFFMGFYSNKVNYKSIIIEIQEDGLNFVLKNSGIVGYNSSHVERKFPTDINKKFIGSSCMVIIDSIRNFIHNLGKDDIINIDYDNEHDALVLRSNGQEALLAKLKKREN